MSIDNPTSIPPTIDLRRPHEHRCEVCGNMYHCAGGCEPGDIYICAKYSCNE